MPEFIAVQCFNCKAFVNQQKKKSKKWKCPICSSKQSVRRIFGISNRSKDIRQLIVELNANRAEDDREMEQYERHNPMDDDVEHHIEQPSTHNKWQQFEQAIDVSPDINDSAIGRDETDDDPYVLQIPEEHTNKKRKGRGIKRKRKESIQRSTNQHRDDGCRYDIYDQEPPTKKLKTNEIESKATNNKKDEVDDWNWDVWDNTKDLENESSSAQPLVTVDTNSNHQSDNGDKENWSFEDENELCGAAVDNKSNMNENIQIKEDQVSLSKNEKEHAQSNPSKWTDYLGND